MTEKEQAMLEEVWVVIGKPLTQGAEWFFLNKMFAAENDAKWVASVMDSQSDDFRHYDENGKKREVAEAPRHTYIAAKFDSSMVKATLHDTRKRN